VIVMVLWYSTVYSAIDFYVPAGHALAEEVQLLYALAITGLGSSISVKLEKMENTLKKDRSKSPAQVEALVGFSDLTQNLIGYLVGCGWSDFVTTVFTSLGDNPEPWTIAQNFVITGAITLAVVLYLASAKAKYALDNAADRDATEQYFIINSMAFFVGWCWLVVTRNCFAQFAILFEKGIEYLDKMEGLSVPKHVGDLVGVVVFSPTLTVFFFSLSGCIMTRLEARTGTEKPQSRASVMKELTLSAKKSKKEELV